MPSSRRFALPRGSLICAAIAGSLSLLLLAACGTLTPPTVSDEGKQSSLVAEAVNDDKAGEQLQDEVMLLNIVRASLHRPRYYVDVSAWAQTLPTVALNNTKNFNLGTGAIGNTAALNLSSETSTATISPLTKQNFWRGITTPVPASLIVYMSQQGFPNSLLLHLFVRELRVYNGEGALLHVYTNSPMAQAQYGEFDAVANGLAACSLSLKDESAENARDHGIIDGLSVNKLQDLQGLADLAEKGYSFIPSPTGTAAQGNPTYMLVKPGQRVKFNLPMAPLAGFCTQTYEAMGLDTQDLQPKRAESTSAKKSNYLQMDIRSPEAVFYYLGEITREQLHGPYTDRGGSDDSHKVRLGTITFRNCGIAADAPPQGADNAANQGDTKTSSCDPGCVDMFDLYSSASPIAASGTCHLLTEKVAGGAAQPVHASYPSTTVDYPDYYTVPKPKLIVDYDNDKYVLSWNYEEDSYTLLVFTIAQQIIGMQNDATDIPKTNLVQTVP